MQSVRASLISMLALALAPFASGCAARLMGSDLQDLLATINLTLSPCPVAITATVAAAYPINGANWNDYVTISDISKTRWAQPDTACAGTETGYYNCLHGGERRKLVVTGQSSCTGLSASDTLGAFDWACDDASGTATFYSKGLKSGKGLKNLIAATGTAFEPNSVTVTQSGCGTIATTTAAAWWTNLVSVLPANPLVGDDAVVLASASRIYTLTADAASTGYNLNADKIAIVTLPGATLHFSGNVTTAGCYSDGEWNPGGTGTSAAACAGSQNYLWIEMDIDGLNGATKFTNGAQIVSCRFARIHNSSLTNIQTYGIKMSSTRSLASDIAISATPIALAMIESRYNTAQRITVTGANYGIYLTSNALDNVVSEVVLDANALNISSADGNNVTDNVLTRIDGKDLSVELLDGTATVRRDNVFGLTLRGASLLKPWAAELHVGNIAIVGDGTSPGLYSATVDNNHVYDMLSSNNTQGVNFWDSSNWTFRGLMMIANNGIDCFLGGTSAGNELDGSCNYGPGLALNASGAFSVASSFAASTRATLSISDTVLRNRFGSFAAGVACPPAIDASTASNVVTDASSRIFLKNAFELVGESAAGNHNGLCESGETCVFAPNLGAYQGSGDPLAAGTCTFTGGNGVTGVSMHGYPTNGI